MEELDERTSGDFAASLSLSFDFSIWTDATITKACQQAFPDLYKPSKKTTVYYTTTETKTASPSTIYTTSTDYERARTKVTSTLFSTKTVTLPGKTKTKFATATATSTVKKPKSTVTVAGEYLLIDPADEFRLTR